MSEMHSREDLDAVIALMEQVRAQQPLVHCLTNHVVKNFTANALLAIGAAPAMVEHPEEAAEFAPLAGAVLVNLGTLDAVQMDAIRAATLAAKQAGRPWVLDPVAVGPLTLRTRFAAELVATRPTVIRGNASEILTLAGQSGGGRGVESGAASDTAREAAKRLAGQSGGAVLVTGGVDYATDASRELALSNGHPLMTRVTGVGCAMGAINAACLAVTDSPLNAAVTTALWLGIAGELAAEATQSPGSYQIALLDALDAVDADALRKRARIS